ncbi:GIY-YIG nuclease family protein [Patescibacteria group bacterium]|nr:GIY-YIG nuclease family protein [Patescibacteria group bacterium]
MENYKNRFELFLKKNKFLPFESWDSFELKHGKKAIFNSNLDKIQKKVNKRGGIYVYKKGRAVLYVGKAVSLFGRLKSHNRESFEPVPGDTEHKTWHKFFSRNKGKLRVYWKEVKLENDRAIIEKMLECVLEPKFKFFRKKFERKIS